jgi:hypothetical protein
MRSARSYEVPPALLPHVRSLNGWYERADGPVVDGRRT